MRAAYTSGIRGRILEDESMINHTSWKIGGPADLLFEPADLDDLEQFLKQLPEEYPVTWVGNGTNLLVRDGGIRGVVIKTANTVSNIERTSTLTMTAEAGAKVTYLVKAVLNDELTGIEFMAGIPGTVGGALWMNAGAFDDEIWNHVSRVEMINRQGERGWFDPILFTPGYRNVETPAPGWYSRVELNLEQGDVPAARKKVESIIERRNEKQPLQWPSCGSVFRNPRNDHAGRLIEAAGLKGRQIGDAQVSDLHGNFIINRGRATAAEVESLIKDVQEQVKSQFNIVLEPEVCVIGEQL